MDGDGSSKAALSASFPSLRLAGGSPRLHTRPIHQQTELWPDDFLSGEGAFSPQAHHARFPATKKNFPAGRSFAASMGILVVQPPLDFLMDGAPFLARLFQRDEPLCSRCPASVFLAERPSAPLTFQALYSKRRSSSSGSCAWKSYSPCRRDRASLVICIHSPPYTKWH